MTTSGKKVIASLDRVALSFGGGRRETVSTESQPVIHEKWRRRTPEPKLLAPGNGDLERLSKQDEKLSKRVQGIRLGLRGVQLVCSLLIVALLAQSLVIFTATKESLINATTTTWPRGVEVWASILVMTFNVAIMVFAFVMVVGTFIGSRLTKKFVNLHTAFIIVSTSITISLQLADAIVLKAQPLDTLPLFQVSCQLWSETNSFEYKTICISHQWAFNFSIIGLLLDLFLLFAIWFIHWRHQTQHALRQSRESIATRLREINSSFTFRVNSMRIPSPTYRGKPSYHPGRLWRLEWGDINEVDENMGEMSPISPGRRGAFSSGSGERSVAGNYPRTYY